MMGSRFGAMTVNERLFEAGLIEQFYAAVLQNNKQLVIALLQQVELSRDQASETAKLLFADPSKYGYSICPLTEQ